MSELDELGKRHKRIQREMEELRPLLHAAIRAERAAGVLQRELMERSGYKTIQQIRTITGEAKGKEAAG